MTEMAIPQATPANHSPGEDLSAGPRATTLASLLAQTDEAAELVAYHGVLAPRELDAPSRETAALAFGAAAHDLGWLRRVAVRGQDRFRWLSGMVTNTVNDLPANGGAWNLVLNAQGRIQGDLHVWREGEDALPPQRPGPVAGDPGLELEIAADQYGRLLAHLDHFIIMDDVELAPLSLDADGELTGETPLGLAGPLAAGVLARLGLPELREPLTSARTNWNGQQMQVIRGYGVLVPHYELWVQAVQIPALWQALTEAGACPVGADALEAFRIAEGIPAYGIDIAEKDLAQETSQMRALSFNKGCYLGQEIVERIRSRGSVHRHLRPLELFGPLPTAGTELTLDDGTAAGKITSAAELPLASRRRCFALAMIRGEAELRNQRFTYIAETGTANAHILAAPPGLEASQGS
jgi:folate-binding protein YgfZ